MLVAIPLRASSALRRHTTPFDNAYRKRYIEVILRPEKIPLLPATDAVVRELRELPKDVEIGYQLQLVQRGKEPKNWRPAPKVDPDVERWK